jgi:hypothetical protein
MTQWPKNESPKGHAVYQGSSSYNKADMDRMEREEKKLATKQVSMTDKEAWEMILHSAREASKVHWASGNLALIQQICEQQLGITRTSEPSPVVDSGNFGPQ